MVIVARERRHEEAHAALGVGLPVLLDAGARLDLPVRRGLLLANLHGLDAAELARAEHLGGDHVGPQSDADLDRLRRGGEARLELLREGGRDLVESLSGSSRPRRGPRTTP